MEHCATDTVLQIKSEPDDADKTIYENHHHPNISTGDDNMKITDGNKYSCNNNDGDNNNKQSYNNNLCTGSENQELLGCIKSEFNMENEIDIEETHFKIETPGSPNPDRMLCVDTHFSPDLNTPRRSEWKRKRANPQISFSINMAPKRPHKTLTLAEKQDILEKLNSGVSGKVLAEKYGIGTSTISDIKKNKDKIMGYIASRVSSPMRKILRKPGYPEMENELFEWFQSQRERHATVTTEILREKAIQIYSKYYNDNKFIASRGWVCRFKKRYGIHQLKVGGEKLSSDSSAVQIFLQKFTKKVNELKLLPSQIYSAGESALYWKLLPDRTFVQSRKTTSKERLTFLACTNGDGTHKVKMMVMGKERSSRAFKNYDSLPVEYCSTKNALMTSDLFVKWFQESFVVQVRKFQADNNLNGKGILLAPSHAPEIQLKSDDGKIRTMFLPPDCSPLIQNAINLTKIYYRKSFLIHVLSLEEDDISKALTSISLKDAVFLLAESWEKLSTASIEKCWKNIFSYSAHSHSVDVGTNSETELDSDDDISLTILKDKCLSMDEDLQELAEIGNLLQQINADNHQPTESEITEWIVGDEDHLPLDADDSSADEDIASDVVKIEHEEAIGSFNTCIQWAEENEVELNSLNILRSLRQRAVEAKQGCT